MQYFGKGVQLLSKQLTGRLEDLIVALGVSLPTLCHALLSSKQWKEQSKRNKTIIHFILQQSQIQAIQPGSERLCFVHV